MTSHSRSSIFSFLASSSWLNSQTISPKISAVDLPATGSIPDLLSADADAWAGCPAAPLSAEAFDAAPMPASPPTGAGLA